MKLLLKSAALGVLLAAAAAAQPAITGLLNNYSWVLPGLPNYGIAQGSIFDIFGANLANSATGLQTPPPTTLNNVTVTVTVNGVSADAPLYFVSSGQIAAVLPSRVPAGNGTITVKNGAQTSAAFSIKVVQSLMGLLTLNNAGTGTAAGFIGNSTDLIGLTNAPNPGETVVLWGTGLGPVSADLTAYSTPTIAQQFAVEIGGVKATVAYAGRSGFAGLDQINVTIPSGVSGCYVTVVVSTGSYVSNFTTLPIATTGRTCSDPSSGYSATQISAISGKSNIKVGTVAVQKATVTTPGITINGIPITSASTTTTDSASAAFYGYTQQQFSAAAPQTVSIGNCIVYTYAGNAAALSAGVLPSGLDAGAAVNVNGPNGKLVLSKYTIPGFGFTGSYMPAQTSGLSVIPPSGGSFTFDNSTGGVDVTAITASLSVGAPLTWTNMSSFTTVNRANSATVTWTGGSGYVQIVGSSFSAQDAASSYAGTFICTAPASAGTFTIPSSVLRSIPASFAISQSGFTMGATGMLTLGSYVAQPFSSLGGLDIGMATASFTSATMLAYQ